MQNSVLQCRTVQNSAEQCRTVQNSAVQCSGGYCIIHAFFFGITFFSLCRAGHASDTDGLARAHRDYITHSLYLLAYCPVHSELYPVTVYCTLYTVLCTLYFVHRTLYSVHCTLNTRSQYYGRSRQCDRPVGAQCSMGLGQNPLINGLIQHTFKLYFLYLEKFTVIPFDQTKLFPVDHNSP